MKPTKETHIYKGYVIKHVTETPKYGSALNFWVVFKNGTEKQQFPIHSDKSSPSDVEMGSSLSVVIDVVDSWDE